MASFAGDQAVHGGCTESLITHLLKIIERGGERGPTWIGV